MSSVIQFEVVRTVGHDMGLLGLGAKAGGVSGGAPPTALPAFAVEALARTGETAHRDTDANPSRAAGEAATDPGKPAGQALGHEADTPADRAVDPGTGQGTKATGAAGPVWQQHDVLSLASAEFPLTTELQSLACYLRDGRLLVAKSHRGDPRIMAYAGRLERLGRVVRPHYVERAQIEGIHNALSDSAQAGEASGGKAAPAALHYAGTVMQSYAMNLFARAALRGASDIHVRVVQGQSTQVLFRVLGDLTLVEEQVASYGTALCSTIYQAMTDQSDATFVTGQPQDGRISDPQMLPRDVSGIRVATTPQVGGHIMVLRLLYKANLHGLNLGALGFSVAHQQAFANLRRRPTGIIVNSGPTGAGKSTTLQCTLMDVIRQSAGRKHIITVEDPPEYPIPGAVQTPVVNGHTEETRSLAFQSAIRAAMRLDPDIIMIGEMRDGPSSRLAVAAAMTGHQVWTTLHANYAIDIMERLIDLGVPIERLTNPSVLSGLVAQRLVKSLCPHCRAPLGHGADTHGAGELARMRAIFGEQAEAIRVRGAGCAHCQGSGYRSRTVLAEVIETDVPFMALMRAGDREGALRHWQDQGGRTLMQHARDKVQEGQIDPFDAEEHILWT